MKILSVDTLKSVAGGNHPGCYSAPNIAYFEVDRVKGELYRFKKETNISYQELKDEVVDLRRELDELKKSLNPE